MSKRSTVSRTLWVTVIAAFIIGIVFVERNGHIPEPIVTTGEGGSKGIEDTVSETIIEEQVQGVSAYNLTARAAVAIHEETGDILIAHNAFSPYPVASLTKFMSALVAIDAGINLDNIVTLSPDDWTIGGTLRVTPNTDRISIHDLVYASLTGSANNAANRLARSTGMSDEEFVHEMNRKSIAYGLEQAQFADPSGLSPDNVATAYEIAIISLRALAAHEIISDAASRVEYDMQIVNTGDIHTVRNPNRLFQRSPERFFESKTGYLHEALYNLALTRQTPQGKIIAVTLGHPDKTGSEEETLRLLDLAERELNQ